MIGSVRIARGAAVAPRLGTVLARLALAATVLSALGLGRSSPRRDLIGGLADTTRQQAFSIVGWEASALGGAALARLRGNADLPTDEAERIALVRAHFATAAEVGRLRGRRDELFRLPVGERGDLPDVERRLGEVEAQFDTSRAGAEQVLAGQVDSTLREVGLRSALVSLTSGDGWPLPFARVEPDVFFRHQRLPLNLIVAPRDRVALLGSVLVEPDLSTAEIERLEGRVDGLGVSSLVSGIGGLGSYPSMIPDTDTLRRSLETISHEWTHHYLAFRPLGRAFFSSYEMRTVNETVADIVGTEIGRQTFERYYAATEPRPPAPRPSAAAAPPAQPGPDFGAEMRRIRAETERRLASGDVAGAEQYMAEQQVELARMGWHVRKLNTAYLSFFGAYGGGGNRYESPLRQRRAAAPSLAAFLREVEQISSPAALRAG